MTIVLCNCVCFTKNSSCLDDWATRNTQNNWRDDLAFPDMTSQPIQNPRLFFCVGSRSTSSGVAEEGTLMLDFAAKKWWNPKISFRILVYALKRHDNQKIPIDRIDTLIYSINLHAASTNLLK